MTVTAAERLGVDAAIIFADILLILEPMGIELEFAEGEGPVIHNPVRNSGRRSTAEVEDASALEFCLRSDPPNTPRMKPDIPLIGFSGAPFTLASYMIEGGGSKNYVHTKRLMYDDSGRLARDDVADLASAREVSERADRCGRAGGAVV